MKNIIALLPFIFTNFFSIGQCSTVAVQISSLDTTSFQLYHAGFFNIPYPAGVYFIQFGDKNDRTMGTKKFLKM